MIKKFWKQALKLSEYNLLIMNNFGLNNLYFSKKKIKQQRSFHYQIICLIVSSIGMKRT